MPTAMTGFFLCVFVSRFRGALAYLAQWILIKRGIFLNITAFFNPRYESPLLMPTKLKPRQTLELICKSPYTTSLRPDDQKKKPTL